MNAESKISRRNRHGFNGIQVFTNWWKYNDIGGKIGEILLSVVSFCLFGLPIVALVIYAIVRVIYVLRWLLLGWIGFSLIMMIIVGINEEKREKLKEKERELQRKREEEKELQKERERKKEWELQRKMYEALSPKEKALKELDAFRYWHDGSYDYIVEFYSRLSSELKFDTDIVEKCMTSICDCRNTRTLRDKFYENLPKELRFDKSIFRCYARANCNRYDDEWIREYDEKYNEKKLDIVDFYQNFPRCGEDIILFLDFLHDRSSRCCHLSNGRWGDKLAYYEENKEFSDYLLAEFNKLSSEIQIKAVDTIAEGLLRTAEIEEKYSYREFIGGCDHCGGCCQPYCVTNPEVGCVGYPETEETRYVTNTYYDPVYIYYFLSRIDDRIVRKRIMKRIMETAWEELVSRLNKSSQVKSWLNYEKYIYWHVE